MKNSIIIKVVIIVLVAQLTSCGKEKTAEKKGIPDKLTVSNIVFDAKNPYYIFIQKNNPNVLKENELICFKEEDIDLDGKKEAIVALGEIDKEDELQTFVSDLFLLRNENGTIKKLAYNFGKDTYSINKVKLISLQGKKQSYIYLGLTNGVNLKGFSLFELVNNEVKSFAYSASGSGVGEDDLVDNDQDGKFDGYVQFRSNMDALYYEIDALYILKDNAFKRSETHVEISPDYPETIENLLLQYISLRSLNFGESDEVNKRLKLICKDQKASSIKWNKEAWGKGYLKNYLSLDGEITFDIQEQEEYVTATVTFIDEDQKKYELQFELELINYKWQINKVTVTKNGEE